MRVNALQKFLMHCGAFLAAISMGHFALNAILNIDLPWKLGGAMALIGVLILHKKTLYRPFGPKSGVGQFLLVMLIYVAPSMILWGVTILLISVKVVPQLGFNAPPLGIYVALLGGFWGISEIFEVNKAIKGMEKDFSKK